MQHIGEFKPLYTHPHQKPTWGYKEQERKRPRKIMHMMKTKNETGLEVPKGMEMRLYGKEVVAQESDKMQGKTQKRS